MRASKLSGKPKAASASQAAGGNLVSGKNPAAGKSFNASDAADDTVVDGGQHAAEGGGAAAATANPMAAAALASSSRSAAAASVRAPSVALARDDALAAASTNLAPGWTAKWSNSRSVCYWVSAADGTSVWEKPVAKLGDTLILTDLSLIPNEDVKQAVSLRRAASGRAITTDDAPAAPAPSADDPGDAAVGLAPGWTPVWSRSRSVWYWKDASGNSTWEKPAKLPAGWVEQYSKSRERPYWRHVDGRTLWERPT